MSLIFAVRFITDDAFHKQTYVSWHTHATIRGNSQARNEEKKENGEAAGWITNFSISVLFFIHSRSRHKRDAATIR